MGARKQRQLQDKALRAAENQINLFTEQQAQAEQALAVQREAYQQFEFENPYANLENVYEDMGVDTQAAQFQIEQGRQQRADILGSLRGSAGASGIAGVAQALAQQGTLQARQVSTDISRQEQQARQLAARGAQGVQMVQAQGQQMVKQAQFGRQATLLGMDYGELAGTRQALQQAYGNEMSAYGMGAQMQSARMGMWGSIIGGVAGGIGAAKGSERKLKRNITLVGKSPSGLNIYNFEYINPKHGEGVHQGVMSDEVPKEAIINHPDGYEMVDYSLIDVNFKKIK